MAKQIKFTGERLIPHFASDRLLNEHFERYYFASKYVLNKRVLDIACGDGYGSNILQNSGARQVVGVDIDKDSIEYAKDKYASKRLSFLFDNACDYKSKNLFDIIVSFETIEHINNYRKALRNFYNLLTLGGLLIISTPNRRANNPDAILLTDKPLNPYHIREFSYNELVSELRDAGFDITKQNFFGQRYRPNLVIPVFQKAYNLITRPDINSSPSVTIPKLFMHPRTTVIVASKK